MVACSSTIEANTPRFSRRLVSLAKKPSTALSHEDEVGVKWKVQRWMPFEPGVDLGVLVRGVVVEHDVDQLAGGHVALDPVEEADEFLVAVALHALPDHGAVEHVERGEQGGGAVALVVMGHGRQPALLHRQPRLGPIQRLDLGLLVDREHDGMRRRVDVQPDDGAQLLGKARVVGELEALHPMRLQPVRAPDPLHRAGADADQPSPWPRRSSAWSRPADRRSWSASSTRAVTSAPKGGMREGRVLSRSSPSTPAVMNRSCQRQTATLLTPACRMIRAVPWPLAVNSTIRARQTCFCGLLRSATTASRRARSAVLSSTMIPLRMRRAYSTGSPPASQIGLVCQILSTR